MDDSVAAEPRTISEIFDDCFPFYLSIGMSSAEYWEGDASLPRYYRKAFEMKQMRENEQAWLHGLYVYDATISALTHLNTDKTTHKSYATKPYALTVEEHEDEKQKKVEEAEAQAEVWMKTWASATQKMFKDN